ncbi:MAG: radical SAM protein [Candidatus Cryosericum sp.]
MSINVKENIERFATTKVIDSVVDDWKKDPEHNVKASVDKIAGAAEKLPLQPLFKQQLQQVKGLIDGDRPAKRLLINLLNDTDANVFKTLAKDFIVEGSWLGVRRQRAVGEEGGFNVPWFMLIDPTERCNYQCTGCWAGSYQQAKEMSFETFDRVLKEASDLGIHFVVVSGGEPTCYPRLIDIFNAHRDMAFMFYTNGSLFTEKFVEELRNVGNAVPCFSVEGFKEKTDERRGEGAWDRVMLAMDRCMKAGIPFGYSVTETHQNIAEVTSDAFVDHMINKGAKLGWYFQYIPIGRTPDLGMMLTPEERLQSYHRIHEIRSSKPVFVADFWNDGPYTGGCIAGARRYFHVTADGNIEPCAFIHLTQGNINEMSLKDALQLPFFQEMQKLQPYSDNALAPCILIDHPDYFRKIAAMPGVRGTDGTVENMSGEVGAHLDKLSKEWETLSHPVYMNDFPEESAKFAQLKKEKVANIERHGGDMRAFYTDPTIEK